MASELLTKSQLAEWLCLKPAGVDSLMKRRVLKLGVHFIRPPGLQTRFKRQAILQWLEGPPEPKPGDIPMSRGYVLQSPASAAAIPMAKGYTMN